MAKKKAKPQQKPGDLNINQEKFCRLFVSEEYYGNGTKAYALAYGKNLEDKKEYNVAAASASELLRNPKICMRISEMLDEAGLNDHHVDKQLLFVMTQNADLSSKVAAIREYNKLRARIQHNLNVHHTYEEFDGEDPEAYVKDAISKG